MPWERLVYTDLIKVQMEEDRIRMVDQMNAMKDTQALIKKNKK